MGSFDHALRGEGLPLFVSLYLAAVLMPVLFNIGPLALTPMRALLLLAMPYLGVRLVLGHFGKLNAADIFFFLHILWATVAVAVNNPANVVQNVGSTAAEFLGGYLVARAYIRTPRQYESLLLSLLLITLALLPLTIPELLNGKAIVPMLIEKLPGLRSVEDVANPPRMGLERVQNVFAHPIHYGLYSSIPFISVVYGLRHRLNLFWRVIAAAGIAFAVFASLSSGALLALLLQIAVLAWALIFRKVPVKWLMLLGLFVMLYVAIDLFSNRTPMRVFMSYATFSSQTAYYRAAINEWGWFNVSQNPIFGLGLRDWDRPAYMESGSVDNFWLLNAMRYGIPGVLLLGCGCFAGVVKVACRDTSANGVVDGFRLTWVITCLGMAFTLVTVHVWNNAFSFVFFFFGSGLWIASYKASDQDTLTAEKPSARPPLAYRRTHPSAGSRPSAAADESSKLAPGADRSALRYSRKPPTEKPDPKGGSR
ncbi:MAG: O-antigen ligase family protein [Rhodobacteraceae bacterium]|nr:O-antigen ligase family protein [Paracoccaceae bacterium]